MEMSFKKLVCWMCFVIILNFFVAFWVGSYVAGKRNPPNIQQFHRKGLSVPPAALLQPLDLNLEAPVPESDDFMYRLAIVLPTMGRLTYLKNSISSYLQMVTPDDLIVVFAVKNKAEIVQMLQETFPKEFNRTIIVENGNPLREHLLRDTCGLARYHNDSLGRVLWRSSIVLEHAWMLYRASFLRPQYVLVMEEDVLLKTDTRFLEQVQERLRGSSAERKWNMLLLRNYAAVIPAPTYIGGAFGMLMNASCPSGLASVSAFLLSHFDDSPVDWMLGLYFAALGDAFGVGASDMVKHIGQSSTKNFSDSANDRAHCPSVKPEPCPTVMVQGTARRRCPQPMVWQTPPQSAARLWEAKFAQIHNTKHSSSSSSSQIGNAQRVDTF